MSSKFSGILAQARNRQNDDEEIDIAGTNESSEVEAVPEPKTAAEKAAPKPKATPKVKTPTAVVQTPPSRAALEPSATEEAPRRGRPQGKRSDPNYTQITAYITKATHRSVKLALLEQGDGQEISEVIEECLRDWVAKRK